jgi:hypothetical protein
VELIIPSLVLKQEGLTPLVIIISSLDVIQDTAILMQVVILLQVFMLQSVVIVKQVSLLVDMLVWVAMEQLVLIILPLVVRQENVEVLVETMFS